MGGASSKDSNHSPLLDIVYNNYSITILSSILFTFHFDTPGILFKPGSSWEQSTTSTDPLQILIAAPMTASFSIGFNEQVEYTNRPPGFNNSRPLVNIRS